MNNVYISTPIYYVNDSPHIGHAYTDIAADVIARFMRMKGCNVFVSTGSDEHGQKIQKTAKELGMEPIALANLKSYDFKMLADAINFKYDVFIRTTSESHKKCVRKVWNTLKQKGLLYKSEYSGWYAVRDEAFYKEQDIKDGKAPTGAPVEKIKEESYFFKLSAFEDLLIDFYSRNQHVIPLSKQNEVTSFIRSGLQDLSVSRTSFSWGIQTPDDEKHVIYVWIDALANYLTSLGFPDTESDLFKTYQTKNSKKIHVIGKDILRFHAVYWPAILFGLEISPFDIIATHGWWTHCGQKMSKSLGNTVNPFDLIQEVGIDKTRYFLMKEIAFGEDGDFDKTKLITKTNSDLANNIGNLVQRVCTMIHKECEGQIPEGSCFDAEINIRLKNEFKNYCQFMENFEFHKALKTVIGVSSAANEFVNAKAPWTMVKSNRTEMKNILHICCIYIKFLGMTLKPFIPESAEKILRGIGIDENSENFDTVFDCISAGTKIPTAVPIFEKL